MEELPPSTLGDGASEEEFQAIFGEQRLLVLREESRRRRSMIKRKNRSKEEGRRERGRRKRRRKRFTYLSVQPSFTFILMFL